MKEIWKDIGSDDRYQVSSFGRVRALWFANGKTRFRRIKVLVPLTIADGYKAVSLSAPDKTQKQHRIHRLVATAFLPNIERKPQVNHKDGNKANNVLANLEWATFSENHLHAYATGLRAAARGELAHLAKLTNRDIFRIRKQLNTGYTQAEIGAAYGVHQSTISLIASGKQWAHV